MQNPRFARRARVRAGVDRPRGMLQWMARRLAPALGGAARADSFDPKDGMDGVDDLERELPDRPIARTELELEQPEQPARAPQRAPQRQVSPYLDTAPATRGEPPARPDAPVLATELAPPERGRLPDFAREALRAKLFGTTRLPTAIGRYEVERTLGAGGMGVVVAARDPSLDRTVAIKLIRRGLGDDQARRARLLREARAMAKLAHPNVVQVFEVGEHEGMVFVAMEFIAGEDLRAWMERARDGGWREVLEVFLQAGRGLAAAHAAGLVHRDFKPENVFVGEGGRARVGDFGLARASSDSARDPAAPRPGGSRDEALTMTGAVLGTPAYMAPEQHCGRATDARTDQFAYCVALWEALCGERPFAGETLEELADAVVSGRRRVPPRGRSVPSELWVALERGLSTDPSERFPGMNELLALLELLVSARPRTRGSRRARRNELLLLDKVREFWVDGVLERGLQGEPLLELDKDERPRAVERDAALALERVDEDARPLPPELPIAEYFARRGRALLVLGSPGAGKTTCLLELTRSLLDAAARDPAEPLPVVLNLSTWGASREPLATWVVDQMNELYRIPRSLSRGWLASESLALMLDGLDEVAPARRPACVDAINHLRAEHGLTPVAVACRRREYDELTTRLQLDGAVELRSLSDASIESYLMRRGAPTRALAEQLEQDEALRELARTPLMLNIMALAHNEPETPETAAVAVTDGRDGTDLEERRLRVFDRYARTMLRRERRFAGATESHASAGRYSPRDTLRWLGWMARVVVGKNRSVFLIEQLQPGELGSRAARWLYVALSRLLLIALILSPVQLDNLAWKFVLFALLNGAVLSLFAGRALFRRRSPARRGGALVYALALFLTVLTASVLAVYVLAGPGFRSIEYTLRSLAMLSLPAALITYVHVHRRRRLLAGEDIVTVETLGLSWRRLALASLVTVALPGALLYAYTASTLRDAVVVWDVDTGDRVATLLPGEFNTRAQAWTHDGARVIVALDGAFAVAPVDGGEALRIDGVFDGLTPDGRYATGTIERGPFDARERQLAVWRADTWERVGEYALGTDLADDELPTRYGADNKTLLRVNYTYISDRRGHPVVVDFIEGRVLRRFPPLCRPIRASASPSSPETTPPGECTRAIRMTDDGRHILQQRDDYTVDVFGLAPLRRVARIELPRLLSRRTLDTPPPLEGVDVHPSGAWVTIATPRALWRVELDGSDNTINAARQLAAPWGDEGRHWRLRFAMDGARLLAARTDRASVIPVLDALSDALHPERDQRVLLLDQTGETLAEYPDARAFTAGPGGQIFLEHEFADARTGALLTARAPGGSAGEQSLFAKRGARAVINRRAQTTTSEVWDLESRARVLNRDDRGLLSPDGACLVTHRAAIQTWPLALLLGFLGVVGALLIALEPRVDALKTRPNEGIYRTARRAPLVFTIVFVTATSCILGTFYALRGGLHIVGLLDALPTVAFVALLAALALGGFAVVCHVTLRLLLSLRGDAPWRYARFLDFACERVLLRRVGGGYIFIHRMLAEYFAEHAEARLSGELEDAR